MNKITIDGKEYNVSGRNVKITHRDNQTVIDVEGNVMIVNNNSSNIKIKWEGDLANLDCTSCEINGNVTGDIDSTNITVKGNVGGNIDCTNITCNDVIGNIDANIVSCKTNNNTLKM